MRIEVLVATTEQTDLSLFQKMNIRCDAIFANQCESNWIKEDVINGHLVRMVSTNSKGVGINRNIAMQLSEADICLLSDDDIIYKNDAFDLVLNEFENNPRADIISFSLTGITEENERLNSCNGWTKRTFGAARIAYRNVAVQKANLSFSRLFGGGAPFMSGEDSLFCIDAMKANLNIFQTKTIIGEHGGRTSTWFQGYNDKFYIDRGAFFAIAYPRIKNIMCLQLLLRHPELYKVGQKSLVSAFHLMRKGFDRIDTFGK